ncbi:MAG: 2OG-Fe(II) oxygenase [Xanthobacteraceae bacterium]
MKSADGRVDKYDWSAISSGLDAHGCAVLPKLLTAAECKDMAALYRHEEHFRSHIHMAQHGFGKGEYRYFKYPLPALIGETRSALYVHAVTFANEWNRRMNVEARYPKHHPDYLKICHDAGQLRPTPLLLQYLPGDFNCLHQDLYGELAFPLQVTVLLSEPDRDFSGGEFVLTEQRPRMQSHVEVVPLRQGDAVLFAVHYRPLQGTKGTYRVNLRHGVSRLRSGQRHTLGIIFHDAK